MTNSEIVELIYKDNSFKGLCRRIAKKPMLAEELHSEFILSLLEVKDDRLLKAKNEGYLNVFCVGIINNIWLMRYRIKTTVGKTSPLFEYCNSFPIEFGCEKKGRASNDKTINGGSSIFDKIENKTITQPYNLDFISKEAENILREEMDSQDVNTMYNARVFYYSNSHYFPEIKKSKQFQLKINIENPAQYSEHSKIPYTSVISACNKVKKNLKNKLKKHLYD